MPPIRETHADAIVAIEAKHERDLAEVAAAREQEHNAAVAAITEETPGTISTGKRPDRRSNRYMKEP